MSIFKKKNKMTIKQFAYYNLGIIVMGAGNFFENNKEFLKFDLYSEIAYYTFFTYISGLILLKKYSKDIVKKIVELIIDRMIDVQYEDCMPKTEEVKNRIHNLYEEYYNKLEAGKFDLNDKNSVYNMAKLFFDVLEITPDMSYIMKVSIEFSEFVINLTPDILNNNIELIEE